MDTSTRGRLAPIERSNWRKALDVRVTDDQLALVADHQPVVLVVLAKSFVGAGGWDWEPLVYETDDGHIVAVLGLAHEGSSSQLFNLAVDHRHQQSGIGTATMMAVIEHVRRRSCSSLSLTVHPDNAAAQALYRKVGFVPTGEIRDEEPVWAKTFQTITATTHQVARSRSSLLPPIRPRHQPNSGESYARTTK